MRKLGITGDDMKTRCGFVSNSSSSSFIIALDRKPRTAKELRDILFPGYGTEALYVAEMERVRTDLKRITEKQLKQELRNSWIVYEIADQEISRPGRTATKEQLREYHDKMNALEDKATESLYKEWKEKYPEKKPYLVHYSDHGTKLEQDLEYKILPYAKNTLQISHH